MGGERLRRIQNKCIDEDSRINQYQLLTDTSFFFVSQIQEATNNKGLIKTTCNKTPQIRHTESGFISVPWYLGWTVKSVDVQWVYCTAESMSRDF